MYNHPAKHVHDRAPNRSSGITVLKDLYSRLATHKKRLKAKPFNSPVRVKKFAQWPGPWPLLDTSTSRLIFALGLMAVCLAWSLWRVLGLFALNPVLESIGNSWGADFSGGDAYVRSVVRNQTGFMVWHALGFSGQSAWVILHFAALVVGIVIVCFGFMLSLGAERGALATAFFSFSTVFAVLFSWIGSYDAWTFLGMALVAVAWYRSPIVLFIAVSYLSFQHYGQAVFLITSGILASYYFRSRIETLLSKRVLVTLIGGWCTGFTLMKITEPKAGSDGRNGLLDITDPSNLQWLIWKFEGLPYIVYSLLGPLIVLLLFRNELHRLRKHGSLKWVGAAIVVAVIPAVITNEPTRPLVFALFLPLIWWLTDFMRYHRLTAARLIRMPAFWVLALTPPVAQFAGDNIAMGLKVFLDGIRPLFYG